MKPKKREETRIQRAIEATLGHAPDITILRNNNGVATFDDGARVVYGLGVGTPDLVCILQLTPALAAWVALEVKVPGEEPEPAQRAAHALWRSLGVQVFTVHSVDEAAGALEIARGVARSEARMVGGAP